MWGSRLAIILLLAYPLLGQPVRPNIFIDNDTGLPEGSASGAPEGMAPIVPPNQCSTTGASSTINSAGHGLGATPVDGSAAVWMNTASGPRWCVLTGIPNGDTFTVQCRSTPNIAVAVDCVVGGRLAGPLGGLTISTSRGLCPDFADGWTITIVNTGTTYVETNTQGCPIQNNPVAGGISSQGRPVIRGDDADNPTPIEVQFNGNYIFGTSGTISVKYENLEFIRNAAGTTGVPLAIGNGTDQSPMGKNLIVRQITGTWATAFSTGGRPDLLMSSQIYGSFTTACAPSNPEMFMINNYWEGCSGSSAAFTILENPMLFNLIDNGGVNQSIFNGSVNNGAGGFVLYNTLLNSGAAGLQVGENGASIYSGNYLEEGSTLSAACWDAGTNGDDLLGAAGSGEPTNIWRGNAANVCTTARYGGGLDTSSQGAATDVDAGLQFDVLFQNAGALDFFPTNALAKSTTVFPGSAYPLLTPALPLSTMTVGAAQLPGGGGGVSAYAY